MNLPLAICISYAAGIVAALSARAELRGTPRPALATSGFRAFLAYVSLVLVPSTVYFYLFHGDWFLLYLVDSQRIPSAVALLLFVMQASIAALGFASGAHMVRLQRENLAIAIVVAVCVLAAGLLAAVHGRFATVGTYAQFHGTFGLDPWLETPLLPAIVLFGTVMLVGLVHCCVRIHWGARRAGA